VHGGERQIVSEALDSQSEDVIASSLNVSAKHGQLEIVEPLLARCTDEASRSRSLLYAVHEGQAHVFRLCLHQE